MSKKYTFDGAVFIFGKPSSFRWKASTFAVSKEKALSNLKYRYRQFAGLVNYTPLEFVGNIVEE